MRTIKEQYKQFPINPIYEISNMGNIRRIKTHKDGTKSYVYLKPCDDVKNNSYPSVTFVMNGKQKQFRVRNLVLMTFLGLDIYNGLKKKLRIMSNNGLKTDNRLENLSFVSVSYIASLKELNNDFLILYINGSDARYFNTIKDASDYSGIHATTIARCTLNNNTFIHKSGKTFLRVYSQNRMFD